MDMVNKGGDAAAAAATADHSHKSYKGVRKRKWGKWVSEIRLPNSRERIWLGSYDSPQKAARAFDAALYCLRGCRANFNFPDTPSNLDTNLAPIAAGDGQSQTLTPAEIQVAAARFANEYPNNQEQEPSESATTNSSKVISTTTTDSSSSTVYECDRFGHNGDNNKMGDQMDWAFLSVLDDDAPTNYYKDVIVGSDHDYGFYSSLDNMHSGEFLYSTSPPPFQDNVDQIEGSDPFSHQSSLWNWNF